ncbi:hypothetical protein BpHYR1_006462, partial [Brachionus plicatilis]
THLKCRHVTSTLKKSGIWKWMEMEQSVQPFDVNNEDDISQRWNEWITRLEKLMSIKTTKLNAHFKSKFNVKLNTLHFRDIYQHQGAPFEEFLKRLKEKAKLCAFTDPNTEIAIQIIHGCQSNAYNNVLLKKL